MKRYLLFCFNDYYPQGGWDDFIGDYDSIEECIKNSVDEKGVWLKERRQIVDTQTKEVSEE